MSTKQFTEMTRKQAIGFMPQPEIQPVRARLAELVGDRYVVDIGCGKADEVSNLFAAEKYLGIDCSPELIRIARRNNPGYIFLRCDAMDMTSHPCAIIKAVLEHLPPAEALTIYNHVRSITEVMYVAWHTEPGKEKLSTYDGELGVMLQNRHDRKLFHGITSTEICGKHVIWTVI